MVIRRPMGVCAAITPYNFPLTLLGTKVAPALASGNTVVSKPAATTPLATLEVARIFAEAGVGRHVASVAAPQMKRLSLELGGSDPVIVCEDADVDAAVKAVIIGRYWNAGQACLGCKRVFVHDAVYDAFVGQLEDGVANGGEVLVGGGTGSGDKGWFLEPAVIAEPGDGSRLVREE